MDVVRLSYMRLSLYGWYLTRQHQGTDEQVAHALRIRRFLFFRFKPRSYSYAVALLLRNLFICLIPAVTPGATELLCICVTHGLHSLVIGFKLKTNEQHCNCLIEGTFLYLFKFCLVIPTRSYTLVRHIRKLNKGTCPRPTPLFALQVTSSPQISSWGMRQIRAGDVGRICMQLRQAGDE